MVLYFLKSGLGVLNPLVLIRGFLLYFYSNILSLFYLFLFVGELIGVEYLFSQTGKVLQDFQVDSEAPNEPAADEEADEGFEVGISTLCDTYAQNLPLNTVLIIYILPQTGRHW